MEACFAFSPHLIPGCRGGDKGKFSAGSFDEFRERFPNFVNFFRSFISKEGKFILCIFQFAEANVIIHPFDENHF